MYILRSLEPILRKAVRQFTAVVLTGPRQAGKTTLLKHLFGKSHGYISLDTPDMRAAALSDPRGFLELYPPPVIYDEIQSAPDLLPYIKEAVDENRDRCGQFILTGSQNILLSQHVTESLAGRAAILKLLPLSYPEICADPQRKFPWESRKREKAGLSLQKFWKLIARGSYPELIDHPKRDAAFWHSSYLQTYLERDVRNLRQVGDLAQFQHFLQAVAIRSGQLFQLSDVSRDIGMSVNTIKAWLAILEATYQIIILRPYYANIGKRLVKTPKIYFTDTGMLSHLLKIHDPHSSPFAGALMENYVVSEMHKRFFNRGEQPSLHFWRTSTGQEVDLIVERENGVLPIEVKTTATPRPAMAQGISAFRKDLGAKAQKGYLLHLGGLELPLTPEVSAFPIAEL